MDHTTEEQPAEPKARTGKRKIIIFWAIGIAVFAGAILFYFFYLENPIRQVLAQVNDEKIMVDQFNKEIAQVEPPLMRDMLREEPNNLLERIVVKTLLL